MKFSMLRRMCFLRRVYLRREQCFDGYTALGRHYRVWAMWTKEFSHRTPDSMRDTFFGMLYEYDLIDDRSSEGKAVHYV